MHPPKKVTVLDAGPVAAGDGGDAVTFERSGEV
jgi:hypothetical protein